MLNIDKFGKFEPIGLKKKKRQIILNHTSREVGDYLTSLEFRYNKKYDKIPNYIITREGEILQLLPETGYSNVFDNSIVNENSIIITLENLGWLEKKPLLNYYINWIGSIYKQEVYNKKWRDYFFWEPYDDRQFDMTVKLCNELLDNMNIENIEIIIEETPYHNRYKKRYVKVKEIIDEFTIEIYEEIELSENEKSNILIYGKRVNDFNKLDYSSLYSLNIACTQELYKIIQEQKNKIDELEQRIIQLENR